MSGKVSFSFRIASSLPAYERDLLIASIQNSADDVQIPENRAIGIDDFIIIIAAIGATAEATSQILDLAEKIIDWRKRLSQKGMQPEVEINRQHEKSLDLSKATDQEVENWFKPQ